MDNGLHVAAVEVVVRPAAERGKAHFVVEERAEVCKVVDIETGVHEGQR